MKVRAALGQFTLLLATCALAPFTRAQSAPDTQAIMQAQTQTMQKLSFMDGAWRGTAWTLRPDGSKHEITQTERIGPFLGNTVKVIEGRGYEPDGRISFNAFATISYDLNKQSYQMRSYAQGYAGDFTLVPTERGYFWTIPMGPVQIRYTMTLENGEWLETGERLVPGKDPQKFFEMRLKRLGDSDWPAAGAIPPK